MTEEIITGSWGSRLKDAFAGILIGLALIVAAIVLIFWNEKHSLHTALSLEQAQKVLISIPNSPVNEQNNLKVVYLSGMATTQDKLVDSLLGVTVTAINLDRKVEMYQWQEKVDTRTESQMGGSEKQIKTYTYRQIWSDKLIDSSNFKTMEGHQNPAAMPIPPKKQYAKTVSLGDFTLPETLITQIDVNQAIDLATVNKEALKSQFNKPVALISNEELYVGQDAKNPQLGDMRITMTAAYPQNVSIIAQQTGHTLQAFVAPAGETVLLLSPGQQSPQQMIEDAQSQNSMLVWILRLVSFLMLFGGFSLILKPIVVLADVLPFLGSIASFGTGFIAFICGLSIWIIMTAIAWFTTRPMWSVGLLVILIAGVYWLVKRRSKRATPVGTTIPPRE